MKKLALFLVFVLALSILPAASFATTPQVKVTTFKEITDKEELLKRAMNGISDLPNKKKVKEGVVTNLKTKKAEKVKIYSTTQLLKVQKDVNGNEEREYATTDIGILETLQQTGDKTDPTYTIKLYSTIYWSKSGDPVMPKYKLTKATGGYTKLDSTWYVKSQTVTLKCNGPTRDDGRGVVRQEQSYYPAASSSTFSYNAPTSWVYVYSSDAGFGGNGVLGARHYIIMKRGTSEWAFLYENSFGPF